MNQPTQTTTERALNPRDFTECFAVPGARQMIDLVHPRTGLSAINGLSLEQIRARYPEDAAAVKMTIAEWQAARAAVQDAPIQWRPTTEEQFDEMLNVLPPAAWINGGFLVGEPSDHHAQTGAPRFQAYRQRGQIFEASTRPLTRAEFRAEMRANVEAAT